MAKNVVLGFIIVGLTLVWACELPADAPTQGGVSLLNTLADWKYPDSKFHGASMSDGGNPQLQSIKCQAVLTTADPFEKVVEFYAKKLGVPQAATRQDTNVAKRDTDAKSVTTQDDSKGRPVAIRIIVVNKAKTSTTLVISRAKDEKETHIAWLHYIRL